MSFFVQLGAAISAALEAASGDQNREVLASEVNPEQEMSSPYISQPSQQIVFPFSLVLTPEGLNSSQSFPQSPLSSLETPRSVPEEQQDDNSSSIPEVEDRVVLRPIDLVHQEHSYPISTSPPSYQEGLPNERKKRRGRPRKRPSESTEKQPVLMEPVPRSHPDVDHNFVTGEEDAETVNQDAMPSSAVSAADLKKMTREERKVYDVWKLITRMEKKQKKKDFRCEKRMKEMVDNE